MRDMKTIPKMSREERAKQFMPFAALKGYEEELRKQEKILVKKRDLSEDDLEELNIKIKEVNVLQVVSIEYFYNGEYLKITGMVTKIDYANKYIKIVKTLIPFSDITSIEIIE